MSSSVRAKTLKRFFVTLAEPVTTFPAEIQVADEVTCHHLRTVVRAKPGERVVIVDNRLEAAYEAVLTAFSKTGLTLRVEQSLAEATPLLPYATLAVALIKEQRWDWLLQKATELGIRAIQPLLADRSVVQLDLKDGGDIRRKRERWQAVTRSAAEQSEGLFIPQVLMPLSVPDFCASAPTGRFRFLLQERGEDRAPLKSLLTTVEPVQPVVFAIGPEGGWTDREIQAFSDAGFRQVSLGSRILRSETAAIAAMSALIYETAP